MALLKWLPHYFLPWNLLFALSAVAYWAWIIPPVETMRTLSWGWPLWLYAVNAVAVFLFYGAFELHLYVLKRQERRFKYNGKFPVRADAARRSGSRARTSTTSCAPSCRA